MITDVMSGITLSDSGATCSLMTNEPSWLAVAVTGVPLPSDNGSLSVPLTLATVLTS